MEVAERDMVILGRSQVVDAIRGNPEIQDIQAARAYYLTEPQIRWRPVEGSIAHPWWLVDHKCNWIIPLAFLAENSSKYLRDPVRNEKGKLCTQWWCHLYQMPRITKRKKKLEKCKNIRRLHMKAQWMYNSHFPAVWRTKRGTVWMI